MNLEEYLKERKNTERPRPYIGDKAVEAYILSGVKGPPAVYPFDIFKYGMSLPFEKLPLYVNTISPSMKDVLQYRFKQGA